MDWFNFILGPLRSILRSNWWVPVPTCIFKMSYSSTFICSLNFYGTSIQLCIKVVLWCNQLEYWQPNWQVQPTLHRKTWITSRIDPIFFFTPKRAANPISSRTLWAHLQIMGLLIFLRLLSQKWIIVPLNSELTLPFLHRSFINPAWIPFNSDYLTWSISSPTFSHSRFQKIQRTPDIFIWSPHGIYYMSCA